MIARDITSQKLSDQARIEFLSHVSHEMKTPLNTIKAYTEMLVGGEVTGRDTIVEFCNTMNEEAGRHKQPPPFIKDRDGGLVLFAMKKSQGVMLICFFCSHCLNCRFLLFFA